MSGRQMEYFGQFQLKKYFGIDILCNSLIYVAICKPPANYKFDDTWYNKNIFNPIINYSCCIIIYNWVGYPSRCLKILEAKDKTIYM